MRSIYYVDDAIIVRAKETDEWGSPVAGDPAQVPIKCKLTFEYRLVTDVHGNEVTSSIMVEMDTITLSTDDRIKVDGIDCGILNIRKPRNSFGVVQFMEVDLA